MPSLPGRALRWVADEPQPGLIEFSFLDANGLDWRIIDKTVCFHGATFSASSHIQSTP